MSAVTEIRETAAPAQLSAGDVTIGYRQAGAGAPLVLLHGIGSNAGSWRDQLDGLADLRRVIAWDAPGYGVSTPLPAARPVAADYAERLNLLLDGLQIDRIDLIGHSLGALMAASFVRQWPARVSRLILADVAAGYGVAPTDPLPASVQNRLDDLDTLGPAGMAEKRAARLLSPSAPQDRVARVREAMAAIDPAGYRQAAAMLAQGNLGEDAAQIEVPVLVICGAQDVITPPAGNRTIAENMPNAQYVEIPDAGHASYIDRPDAFNALARNFLAAP